MSEFFKPHPNLRTKGLYFEPPKTQAKTGFPPIVWAGLTVTVVVAAAYFGIRDADGFDGGDLELGTDRPAGEDEYERRVRERYGTRVIEEHGDIYAEWHSMSDDELLQYYRDNYNGVSVGKLKTIDGRFHQALWRRGLLDDIERADWRMDWAEMSDAQMLAYYDTHYPDFTRGELAKIDRAFYEKLRRRDLLQYIPVE